MEKEVENEDHKDQRATIFCAKIGARMQLG